ncbi:hypothetical protein [Bifidobacterium sp. SO1]|uniref:hypothetical protein n=1 Tax=Bifidobacterium sp. SO1 TaxID=2809029 RepID=UPI001BDBBF78|nr:hypothetical protein [Bifidobacterium sp. SO1]MBT1161817.1 hypothetical protein [Bifidobacterium sp. SO1]
MPDSEQTADTVAQIEAMTEDMTARLRADGSWHGPASGIRYDRMERALAVDIECPRFHGADPLLKDEYRCQYEAFLLAGYGEWFRNPVLDIDGRMLTVYIHEPSPIDAYRLAWLSGLAAPPIRWADWRPIPVQAHHWVMSQWERRLRAGYQWIRA